MWLSRLSATVLISVFIAMLVACGDGSRATISTGNGSPPSPPPPGSPAPTVVSLRLTPIGPAISIHGAVNMTATATYSDGSVKDVTSKANFASDTASIASVSGSTVTGVSVGVAKITGSLDSKTDSTLLSVTTMTLNNATLNGRYAFLLRILGGGHMTLIAGSFHADGKGNILGGTADISSTAGVKSNVVIAKQQYVVWADGRGVAPLNIDGQVYMLAFIVSQDGSGGKMISFDANVGDGVFERQDSSLAALGAGNWVFAFAGLQKQPGGAAQPLASIGVFDTQALNTIFDRRISTLNVNSVGTFAATSSVVGTRGTAAVNSEQFAYYLISGSKALFIQIDGGSIEAGFAFRQSATVINSGTYFFLLDHAPTSNDGTFENAGQFTLDAFNGTLAGGRVYGDFHEFGDVTSGTLTYQGAPGRAVLNMILSSSTEPHNAVIYVVDSGHYVMMNSDSVFPGIGAGDLSQPIPLANGPFTFSTTELGELNVEQLGQIMVSNSSVTTKPEFTGFSYLNQNGAVSAVVVSGTVSKPMGRGFINPFQGSPSPIMMVDIINANHGIMLGMVPDIDGRMDAQ
jgi:hypothetical protein